MSRIHIRNSIVPLIAAFFPPVDRLYAQMHMGVAVDAKEVVIGSGAFSPRPTDLPERLILIGQNVVELNANEFGMRAHSVALADSTSGSFKNEPLLGLGSTRAQSLAAAL